MPGSDSLLGAHLAARSAPPGCSRQFSPRPHRPLRDEIDLRPLRGLPIEGDLTIHARAVAADGQMQLTHGASTRRKLSVQDVRSPNLADAT